MGGGGRGRMKRKSDIGFVSQHPGESGCGGPWGQGPSRYSQCSELVEAQ